MRRAAPAILAALVAAVLLAGQAGCGLGPGSGASSVTLTVTRDFGARPLGSAQAERVPESETVMRLLQRDFAVKTRYGGQFVVAIRGLAGGEERGRPVDWFFYVNGIEAGRSAAATRVHAGDRVWWDRHDWGAAMRAPAVVGSFPEPFRSGEGGKRLPVRIECARVAQRACDEVARRLKAVGVAAARTLIGAPSEGDVLRVLVGPWAALRGQAGPRLIEEGPSASGVYARFEAGGRRLVALDARGRATRTLGAGTGLVAAVRYRDEAPTWVVTGPDAAGALAAAGGLEEGALADRFALAVDAQGLAVRLPEAR